MENYIELSFCIWGFEDISHDIISKELNLNPSAIHVKGKPISPSYGKIAKENGWIYRVYNINDKSNDFNKQLNLLLDILEPRLALLKKYSSLYCCEFSCGIFLFSKEESTPWIHFDKRYNKFIRETDVEFDFDIY